jgi:SNF family Na+-dependent transporter
MASVEITITSFLDLIPWLKKTKLRKVVLVTTICTVYFLLGMPYCTQAGTYWVDIVDNYSGSWAVLLTGALECISITWFYGKNLKGFLISIIKKKFIC